MKFQLFIFVGLVLAVSAAPTKEELEKELAKGFTNFLSNFFQQVVLPPVVTAVQDSAGLLAQLTAGLCKKVNKNCELSKINYFFYSAEGGLDSIMGLFGKRDIVIPKGIN
jgi:hypothetical protein